METTVNDLFVKIGALTVQNEKLIEENTRLSSALILQQKELTALKQESKPKKVKREKKEKDIGSS